MRVSKLIHRLRRWIYFFIFLGLLFLLIHTPPAKKRAATLLSQAVSRYLGQKITLVSLDYRLWRGEVEAAQVKLESTDQQTPMEATADRVKLTVSLFKPFSAIIERPRVTFSVGTTNQKDAAGISLSGLTTASLPRIEIRDGEVCLLGQKGARLTVDGIQLTAGERASGSYAVGLTAVAGRVTASRKTFSFGPVRMDLALRDAALFIHDLVIDADASRFEGKGRLDELQPLSGEFNLHGDLDMDTGILKTWAPGAGLSGLVKGRVHLKAEQGHIRGEGAFEGHGLKWGGKGPLDFDGQLRIDWEQVMLRPVNLSGYGGRAELRADLSLNEGGIQQVHARYTGLDLAALLSDFTGQPVTVDSRITGETEIRINNRLVAQVESRSRIQLAPVSDGDALPLTGTISLTGKGKDFNVEAELAADSIGAVFRIDGNLNPEEMTVKYNIELNEIGDLQHWIERKDALPEWVPAAAVSGGLRIAGNLTGSPVSPDWNATLRGEALRIGESAFDLAADLRGSAREARLERLELIGAEVSIEGDGTYEIGSRSLDGRLVWENLPLDRISAFGLETQDVSGRISGSLEIQGPLKSPNGRAHIALENLSFRERKLLPIRADLEADGKALNILLQSGSTVLGRGTGLLEPPYEADLAIDLASVPFSRIFCIITGREEEETKIDAQGQFAVSLPLLRPGDVHYRFDVEAYDAVLGDFKHSADDFIIEGDLQTLRIEHLKLITEAGHLAIQGSVPLRREGTFDLVTTGTADIEFLEKLLPGMDLAGRVRTSSKLGGTLDRPIIEGEIRLEESAGRWGALVWTDLEAIVRAEKGRLYLLSLKAKVLDGMLEARGEIPLPADETRQPGHVDYRLEGVRIDRLLKDDLPGETAGVEITANSRGTLEIQGPSLDEIRGQGLVQVEAVIDGARMETVQRAVWELENAEFTLRDLQLQGKESDLIFNLGPVRLREAAWEASLRGRLDLAGLKPFLSSIFPGMSMAGTAELDLQTARTLDGLSLQGRGSLEGGRLALTKPPLVLSDLRGQLSFDGSRLQLSDLAARVGGGEIGGTGEVDFSEPINPHLDIQLTASDVTLQVMDGLRGRFSGNIRLAGRRDDYRLSSKLRIIQGLYSKDIEKDSGLGSGLEYDISRPSLEHRFGEGVALDLQIEMENPIRIDNAQAQLDLTGDLSVTGTLAGPEARGVLSLQPGGSFRVGRNRFQVISGRVDLNGMPVSSPTLDLEAVTKVGSALIYLQLSGDVNDLQMRLTAPDDPDLSEGDIASLLVTGRTLDRASEGGKELAATWMVSSLAGLLHEGMADMFSFGEAPPGAAPMILSEEKDPTTRFNVGKAITENLSFTYSIALDDAENRLWILDYQIARNLWIRGIQEDDSDHTIGISHRFDVDFRKLFREGLGEKAEKQTVAGIKLEGEIPAHLEPDFARKIRLKAGGSYDYWEALKDAERLRERLLEEGYRSAFVDVEIEPAGDGVTVMFLVSAGDRLEIVWKGDDPGKKVKKEIEEAWEGRTPESFQLPDLARRAAWLLKARRYFEAGVEASAESTDTGRNVCFNVVLGLRGRDVVLNFEGNLALGYDDLKKALPSTSSPEFFAMLEKPASLERGIRLRYASLGYLDVSMRAHSSRFDPDTGILHVAVTIDEGEQSRISGILVDGIVSFPESRIREVVDLHEGTPVNLPEVRHGLNRLKRFYQEEGFLNIKLESRVERDSEGIRIDISMDEGRRARVGKIHITGCKKTRERTIRRHLAFKEGDPLRLWELRKSQKNLYELGIFRSADVRIDTGQQDEIDRDILVTVSERSDLEINYGVRYNVVRDAVGDADVESTSHGIEGLVRGNFANLLGRGFTLSMSAYVQRTGHFFRASLLSPHFFSYRLPTVVYFEQKNDVYEEDLDIDIREWHVSFQQSLKLGQVESSFRDRLTLQWYYKFGRFALFKRKASKDNSGTSGGPSTTDEYRSLIGVSLFEDHRDSLTNPRRGRFWNVTFQVSPQLLGSDTSYYRIFSQYFSYVPVGEHLVWASSYRLGVAQGSEEFLFIPDRFKAGGANSIRGFEQNSLGPFITVEPSGKKVFIGGQAVAVMNQELRFPVYRILHGGVFYDVGNVFPTVSDMRLSDLRHSAGAGLRLVLPIGAMRLDWARILDLEPEEKAYRFHFSFGYAF